MYKVGAFFASNYTTFLIHNSKLINLIILRSSIKFWGTFCFFEVSPLIPIQHAHEYFNVLFLQGLRKTDSTTNQQNKPHKPPQTNRRLFTNNHNSIPIQSFFRFHLILAIPGWQPIALCKTLCVMCVIRWQGGAIKILLHILLHFFIFKFDDS